MPLKLKYIGFNPGNPTFYKTDIITRFFKPNDIVVNNIIDANILIIGDYANEYDLQLLVIFQGIKIQYIAEPINNLPYCKLAGYIYKNNYCHYQLGCVLNSDCSVKYPLYMLFPELYIKSTFDEVNNYVKTCEIHNKKFCVLINRHDMGNTRIPIYSLLSEYGTIDCPGKLLNNCSNEELNNVGISTYVKQYKFIICSENYGNDHPGYITEKIMNACLSGAIPIYYGVFDLVDLQIFNINRIFVLDSTNINNIAMLIKTLVNNPNLFEEFYRQPVFEETAYDTIIHMNTNIKNSFDHFRNQKLTQI
jgi:hypothetical protein